MAETRKLGRFDLDAVLDAQGAADDDASRSTERARVRDSAVRRSGSDRPTPIVPIEPVQIADEEERPSPPAPSPPSARVADPRALKTRLARKFTTVADDVNECFHDFFVGAGQWGVELTAPEGMSTAGGKHALQHLRMRPKRPGHPVLVAGVVNAVDKTAELRDHVHMDMIHRVRFGTPLQITEPEWEQLLRRAEVVLKGADIRAVRVPPGRELLARHRARRAPAWRSYALLVALVAASVGAITAVAVHFV